MRGPAETNRLACSSEFRRVRTPHRVWERCFRTNIYLIYTFFGSWNKLEREYPDRCNHFARVPGPNHRGWAPASGMSSYAPDKAARGPSVGAMITSPSGPGRSHLAAYVASAASNFTGACYRDHRRFYIFQLSMMPPIPERFVMMFIPTTVILNRCF
eukprot:COSAG02_NODE_7797_length_2841_cov_7.684014_2_plen_157_part_00